MEFTPNVTYIRVVWGLYSPRLEASFGSNKGFIEIGGTFPLDSLYLSTRLLRGIDPIGGT